MSAAPFFIKPYRFDDPYPDDDQTAPVLDGHRNAVLEPDERVLWRGRVGIAGFLIGNRSIQVERRWTLPQHADVTLTDRRLAYVCEDWGLVRVLGTRPALGADGVPRMRRRPVAGGSTRVAAGQILWQWPCRLHLMPAPGPQGVLIVCDSMRSTRRPGLALSGGAAGRAEDARDLAIAIRRAVAAFRLTNPDLIELSPREHDALLLRSTQAAFLDELTDPLRGVGLPGALPVEFVSRDDYYHPKPSTTRTAMTGGPG
jgi:hypothetical protein